ncbi:hypothetical protein [Bacillus alkalicellulosilyticus]|uniref:hypothetical protein n=1 Tax=Alkalihalobacterium alkalicellulosilyticum TaxID=1912214 RepID=UPI0009970909|nr:hypothetical protein [Bacillus alkalicellulosilyticus]
MNYKKAVTVGIILVTLCFGLYQYVDKQHYVKHLSTQLADALAGMSHSISDNKELYEDILSSETITLQQIELIISNNEHFSNDIREFEAIAVNFNRATSDEIGYNTAVTAFSIEAIFYKIQWNLANEKDVVELPHLTTVMSETDEIKLNDEEVEQIHMIHALNELWYKALIKHIDGVYPDTGKPNYDIFFDIHSDKGFLKNDWIKLIIDLNKSTTEFLETNEKFEEALILE